MLAAGIPEDDGSATDVRDRVFDATVAQLLAAGYSQLSVDAVASAAGVSKVVLQRQWPTKARLVVDALIDRHTPPPEPTAEFPGDMRTIVQGAVDFLSSPVGQTLAQMATDRDETARVELVRWLGPGRAAQLAVLYRAAAKAALPTDIDAKFIVDVVYGTVLWRTLLCAEPTTQLVEQLTGFIVAHEFPREADSSERLL